MLTTSQSAAPRNRHERRALEKLRRIVRPSDAAAMLGVSRMTVYRLETAGKIPPRVRVTDHVVGWYADDLAAYLESRQTVRVTGPCRAPGAACGE